MYDEARRPSTSWPLGAPPKIHVVMSSNQHPKKRPVEDTASAGDEVTAAADHPRKQPRLSISDSAAKVKHSAAGTHHASDGLNVDLLCKVATFINVGDDLMTICIAVGPKDAARIRRTYLLDNDEYVASLLRRFQSLKEQASPSRGEDGLHFLVINSTTLDKCRDSIQAWMEVNDDWRSRCTAERMVAYKQVRCEVNLVFNNPTVAVEIGLPDVVQHFIEEMGISLYDKSWDGFTTLGFCSEYWSEDEVRDDNCFDFLLIALVRNDIPTIHQLLLSPDELLGKSSGYAIGCFGVDMETRKAYFNHPKVNANATHLVTFYDYSDDYMHNEAVED